MAIIDRENRLCELMNPKGAPLMWARLWHSDLCLTESEPDSSAEIADFGIGRPSSITFDIRLQTGRLISPIQIPERSSRGRMPLVQVTSWFPVLIKSKCIMMSTGRTYLLNCEILTGIHIASLCQSASWRAHVLPRFFSAIYTIFYLRLTLQLLYPAWLMHCAMSGTIFNKRGEKSRPTMLFVNAE